MATEMNFKETVMTVLGGAFVGFAFAVLAKVALNVVGF
jgi:hypothetical protein